MASVKGTDLLDRCLEHAMTRRGFLEQLGRASAAALALQGSLLGCASSGAAPSSEEPSEARPNVFTREDRETVARLIDGFAPPELRLRQQLAERDPDYDLVASFEQFIWRHGDVFVENMLLLIRFLNRLPTFAPTFFSGSGLPTFELRKLDVGDVTRFLLQLRDSRFPALRSLFTGSKVIGLHALYVNEPVAWREIGYAGPWLATPGRRDADLERSVSFELARQTGDDLAVLRRGVLEPARLPEGLYAGSVVETGAKLVLETDVVVIGSGAGGSVAASELARGSKRRVLILEKGDFLEPEDFVQRERIMVPQLIDVEFSTTTLPLIDVEVPTVAASIVRGRLVGGSATINHALAFDPPHPVLRSWQEQAGCTWGPQELQPHLDHIKRWLHVQAVPDYQVSGNNLALKRGCEALGVRHHGVAPRNAHQCIGCGFCDMGCRYDRKRTPLNVILPKAVRQGAQILPRCRVDAIDFDEGGSAGRSHKVAAVRATLTDARGTALRPLEIRARRVVLAAGPFDSPRILMRSGLTDLRRRKRSEPAVGERFSTHAPVTWYADFDRPVNPANGGPPMSYYAKFFDGDGPGDPRRDLIAYAIEGIFNHPMTHALLMPYESPERHQEIMRRFNQTMTLTVLFRDRPVGRVTPKGFSYTLPDEDRPRYMEALRQGARLMFAAGARRVFYNTAQPIILDDPARVDEVLVPALLDEGHLSITSGHPMGGCTLGDDPRRDVVDSFGRSWDVDGLYVMDSSVFPTAVSVNPCLTTYSVARLMSRAMLHETDV